MTHLVSLSGEVSGPRREDIAPLARWTGPRLARWSSQSVASGVQFDSPPLGGLRSPVDRLYLRLRPGGAERVHITPILTGDDTRKQALRSIELPLEKSGDEDAIVELRVDLTEVLQGNWAETPGKRLRNIEIRLPDTEHAVLEEVAFESPTARFEEPAGVLLLEHAGAFRPSWYVRGASRVRIPVELPVAKTTLRWHEATPVTGSDCAVRVIDGLAPTEVARSRIPAGWRLRSASLSPWAGKRIVIELACEGDGLGLFGDPRIVQSGDASEAAPPLDVIVYMIDTLRADRLGAFGNAIGVSPVLDRLAAEGARFSFALSSSCWTKPAIPTLLTGIAPTTHRIGARTYADRLPATTPILQERFRSAGWRTAAFSASPLGSTLSDLHRDFSVAFPPRHWGPLPSAGQLHATFLGWQGEEPDRPFFAYIHTLEVHEWSPGEYPSDPKESLARYDAAVRRADRKLGTLLEALKQRGRTDRLLLVVVSDHGESLGFSPRRHGNALLQSQIHIPLIFWAGDLLMPREIETPVGLADVTPTLLDLFGLAPIDEAAGVSLRPLLEGSRRPVHEFVPASLLRFVWTPDAPQRFSLVAADGRKLIVTSEGEMRRFHLAEDPMEHRPVSRAWPRIEDALAQWRRSEDERAAAFRARHGEVRTGVIEEDEAARLRALGYLE